MNIPHTFDDQIDSRLPLGFGGRFYGTYAAVVTDIVDPDNQGRVKIKLPWSPDSNGAAYEIWARLATLMAGPDRGSWFIPEVEDEVLVSFEAGDPRRPYVIGALWNGQDAPPEQMDETGQNNLKTLHSRNGIKITLDDSDGQETLTLETPGGQKIRLADGPGVIEARDSNGNAVKFEASGVTVSAAAKVTVSAGTVEVSAGMVTVNAGMSKFSGVVQADVLISNTVISSSYLPGAGNMW